MGKSALNEKVPNQIIHVTLITFEEILGESGLKSLLNYTGLKKFIGNYPPDDINLEQDLCDLTTLLRGSIDLLGVRGAQPILFRVGRKGVQTLMQKYPDTLATRGIEPGKSDSKVLFDGFVKFSESVIAASNALFGNIYTLYEKQEGLVLDISPCFWCTGMTSKDPICFSALGISYERALWYFGGDIKVEETLCMAKGDECCRIVFYRPS